MNNMDQLKLMLEGAGIPYKIESADGKYCLMVTVHSPSPDDPLVGYNGFSADFTFNSKGKLIRMGIGE